MNFANTADLGSALSATNSKMRTLLNLEGEDGEFSCSHMSPGPRGHRPILPVLEHRLSIMRDLNKDEPELTPLSDLFPSVKPKKDGVQRVHLSRKGKPRVQTAFDLGADSPQRSRNGLPSARRE